MENSVSSGKPISFEHDFPLHYLARIGDHVQIQTFLKTRKDELFRKDFYGRSPLHYAVTTENLKDGALCVKTIITTLKEMDSSSENGNIKFFGIARRKTRAVRAARYTVDSHLEDLTAYLDMKDTQGDTALSLAAKNENPEIVQFLLQNSASIASGTGGSEETLTLIYSKTPTAVISLLNASVTFDYGKNDYDLIHNERKYCLNLTTLVGDTDSSNSSTESESLKHTEHNHNFIETELLHSVSKKQIRARKDIFKHPLVQYFIEAKYDKLKLLTISSVLFNLVWLALYIWIVVDIYYSCCEVDILKQEVLKCADYPFDKMPPRNGTNTTIPNYAGAAQEIKNCIHTRDTIIRPIFTILLTAFVIFKEIFQLVLLRKQYFKLENTVICLCSVVLVLTVFPMEKFFIGQYQISAFGILMASFVILELINKLTYWGIYIKVLIQVLKRFLEIIPLFFFILLSFTLSLRMLFPDKNPRLKYFRDAMMLIFETVANGKVEWSTMYKDSVDNNFPVSGFIMFIGFYFVISLLLFRILIGFVVADTKKIQEEEEFNEFTSKLEQVFIIESFLDSLPFRWLKARVPIVARFQKKFMIFYSKENHRSLKIVLREKEIPRRLQKEIRLLASKNIVSIVATPKARPKTIIFESSA